MITDVTDTLIQPGMYGDDLIVGHLQRVLDKPVCLPYERGKLPDVLARGTSPGVDMIGDLINVIGYAG